MSSFLETKQQTQATTIENLRLETGWKFNALLIKETECNKSLCIFISYSDIFRFYRHPVKGLVYALLCVPLL